jgi:hypothetical protein
MKTIFAAAFLLALIPVPASAHCYWQKVYPYLFCWDAPPTIPSTPLPPQIIPAPPPVYVQPAPPAVAVAPPIVQYQDQIVRQPIIIVPRTLVVPEYQYAQPQVQYAQPRYAPAPQPQYAPAPPADGGYWGAVVDAIEAARRGDQVLN